MLLLQLYTVQNEKEKEKVDKNEVRRIFDFFFADSWTINCGMLNDCCYTNRSYLKTEGWDKNC